MSNSLTPSLRRKSGVKITKSRKIVTRKSTAKAARQIGGKSLQKLFTVSGTLPPLLLKFHEAAANVPIGGAHQRVDSSRGDVSGGVEHLCDAKETLAQFLKA